MTWYGLGGCAEWFAEPADAEALAALIRICRDTRTPCRMLGLGANLLVADDGVDGVVVRLKSPAFRRVEWPEPTDEPMVFAGAGADMSRLVLDATRRGLAGIECMGGIPGTLGGIVRMNAGGRFGSICEVVQSVTVIDTDGELRTLSADEVGFEYRRTKLDGMIVCGASLSMRRDDPQQLRDRCMEIWDYKKKSQPMAEHSAGCVFKNPPNGSAGALIDQAGLKGRSVGGARVSTRHANFIVAQEGATAADVMMLISAVRREVAQRTGIELELEIQTWGRQPARQPEPVA